MSVSEVAALILGPIPFLIVSAFKQLLRPSVAYDIVVTAIRGARSPALDKWVRIGNRDRYAYFKAWDDLCVERGRGETNFTFDVGAYCNSAQELWSKLCDVPTQRDGTRRVYVLEAKVDEEIYGTYDHRAIYEKAPTSQNVSVNGGSTQRDEVTSHINPDINPDSNPNGHCYTPPVPPPSLRLDHCTTSLTYVLSGKSRSPIWCRLDSYSSISGLSLPMAYDCITRADFPFVRVERNVKFVNQNHLCQAVVLCKTFIPHSLSFNQTLALTERDRMLKTVSESRILATALAETVKRHPFLETASFANQLNNLDASYRIFKNASNWQTLFMMQCYHANLMSYSKFVLEYEEVYIKKTQPLFDPRQSEFKQGHLKEIMKFSCRVQEIGRVGNRMVEDADHLVAVAREVAACQTETTSDGIKFVNLELEIRGYCKEIKGCLTRLSASLDHDLKFLGSRRDMSQTNNVQQLTILATIFLPLSLSAGMLSMQTRFMDLGSLLYDFFGVVILLGAFIFPFLLCLRFLRLATDHVLVNLDLQMRVEAGKELRDNHALPYESLRKFLAISLWVYALALAFLILVSFIIGMFKDVTLGLKILGYGMAVWSFPGVAIWLDIFVRWLCGFRQKTKDEILQLEEDLNFRRLTMEVQLEHSRFALLPEELHQHS